MNPNAATLYPLNALPKPDQQEVTGPWQNDYFGIVMAQLAENNEPNAYAALAWISKFNVGRFNAEAQGVLYCICSRLLLPYQELEQQSLHLLARFSRLTFLVKLAAREWSLRVIQHGRVGMQRVPVQRWPLRSMVE